MTHAMYPDRIPMDHPPHSTCMFLYHKLAGLCGHEWSVMRDNAGTISCSHVSDATKSIFVRGSPDTARAENAWTGPVCVSVSINDAQYLQNFRGEMEAYEYLEDYVGVAYPAWPPSDTDASGMQPPHIASALGKRKRDVRE